MAMDAILQLGGGDNNVIPVKEDGVCGIIPILLLFVVVFIIMRGKGIRTSHGSLGVVW